MLSFYTKRKYIPVRHVESCCVFTVPAVLPVSPDFLFSYMIKTQKSYILKDIYSPSRETDLNKTGYYPFRSH